jgi:glycosyltransferase involved in cell wall biosynthesis
MKISVVIPSLKRETLQMCIDSLKEADEIIVVDEPQLCCVDAYNEGLKRANGDVVFQTNDHIVYERGWRSKVEKLLENKGLVSFNKNIVTSGCLRRDYIHSIGGYLYWPEYIHYWGDCEMGEVARRDRQYAELLGYAHFLPKTGSMGHISPEMDDWDEDVYQKRSGSGFPIDTPDLTERNRIAYG